MADSTLTAIRTKVRRLTRSPSEQLLSTADIDEYINTFVLYDFPSHLRLSSLRTVFTFFTEPNQDVYQTVTDDPESPFYNFKDKYITTHEPVYIAGYLSMFSQSREQFFSVYPMTNNIASIGTTGDGVTTTFSGTLAAVPVLKNQVLFDSVNNAGTGLELHDDGLGNLIGTGVSTGTIDYVTGAFTLNFETAPGAGKQINSQTVPYVAALPQALLWFQDTLTLRPVPDQPYRVDLEAYIRPTALLADDQSPELQQWWQYIAYGASKKVFEDRMDLDSVQQILPEFKQQERLVVRTTIVQQTKERTATIYSEQTTAGAYGPGWYYGGGNF